MIENLENEIWVDIKDWEEFYQVSNYSRIKSKEREHPIYTGQTTINKERILSPTVNKRYNMVNLRANGIIKAVTNHRIAAMHFLDNPDNKPYVNHIDHNKKNNHISNLEWCTQLENVRHMIGAGRQVVLRGQQTGMSKLKNEDIYKIYELKMSGFGSLEISKRYGVSQASILNIFKGKTWKHIPAPANYLTKTG